MAEKSDLEYLRDLKTGPIHEDLGAVALATTIGGLGGWFVAGLWSMFRPVNIGNWAMHGGFGLGAIAGVVVFGGRVWP